MTFNCNDSCTVYLTEYGKDVYQKSTGGHQNWNKMPDGSYRFQLWEIFSIFGQCMYMGNPDVPFVNNKINIKE